MQGNDNYGISGFLESDMTAFGFTGNKPGALEGAHRAVSGDARQPGQTLTSTWLVRTSLPSARTSRGAAFR